MKVTIIGTGSMGRGVGTRLLVAGADLRVIGTSPQKGLALARELNGLSVDRASVDAGGPRLKGELVVLAVPYPAVSDLVEQYADQFSGRTVLDITNPLNATFDGLLETPAGSGAQEIQRLLPEDVPVVKCFNTTFARTLARRHVGVQELDVFVAADNANAKAVVTDLVRAARLRPIDAGPLRRARELEAMALLHITLQAELRTEFASAIKVVGAATGDGER